MKKGIDYIWVWTWAMVFNNLGEVFISQRWPKAKNEKWKWEFPGGGVDFGETCENTILREVKEEFDMHIEITELLEVVNHIIPEENQHWVSPSYIAKYISWDIKIMEDDKCVWFKWVKLEELGKYDLSLASLQNYHTYTDKYGHIPPTK